jgi:hypothetical protein
MHWKAEPMAIEVVPNKTLSSHRGQLNLVHEGAITFKLSHYPHMTGEALVEAQIGIDLKTLGTTVVPRMLVALRRRRGSGGSRWRTG